MKNIIFQFIYIGILVTSTKCFAEDEISVRWKPLDELAKKAVSSAKIPGGSVCVVENGSVVFNQSYGVLNEKTTKLWESNTPVFIASITKPITATLVAVLVEQKKLSFDDPISKYIPEYSKLKLRDGGAVRSPTIAECLSHTSGFPGGNMGDLPRNSQILKADQAEVAKLIAKGGLVAKPGKRFAYTFRGYAAVARCMEVATGRRYAELLNEKLLKPLGMAETSFFPDLEVLKRHPRYLQRIAGSSKEEVKAVVSNFKAKLDRFVSSSGGLVSTSNDLVRFFRLHSLRGKANDKQLISFNVISRLYQKPPGSRGYGLGFKLFGDEIVGHGGASGTSAIVDLKHDRVVVVLTQAGSKNARPLTGDGKRLALEILSR